MVRLSVANNIYYAGETTTHLIRGNVKVEGVRKPVHDVEQEPHEDCLLYRLLTPALFSFCASSGPTSPGVSVSFSRKPRVALSPFGMDADLQPSRTTLTVSLPRFNDATAPWCCFQYLQRFTSDTKAAKSSISPLLHSSAVPSRALLTPAT